MFSEDQRLLANLGDLRRLWVRSGVQINLSVGFSRAVGSTSDTSSDKMLYKPINPIARHSEFSEKGCSKEKTTLPEAPDLHLPNSFTLPHVICVLVEDYELHSLSRYRGKACECGTPVSSRNDSPMSNCWSQAGKACKASASKAAHPEEHTTETAERTNHFQQKLG